MTDRKNNQLEAQKAYHAANERFRSLHSADWERILEEERKLRGLDSNSEAEKRRKKILYFEKQIMKYQNKLEELNGE